MDFLYVFSITAMSLCVLCAYSALFFWVATKAELTGLLRYKLCVVIMAIFAISFLVAGLATR